VWLKKSEPKTIVFDSLKYTYLYTPIFIELLTGLRLGELCGLRWCDINFNTGYLTIRHQVVNDMVNNTFSRNYKWLNHCS